MFNCAMISVTQAVQPLLVVKSFDVGDFFNCLERSSELAVVTSNKQFMLYFVTMALLKSSELPQSETETCIPPLPFNPFKKKIS